MSKIIYKKETERDNLSGVTVSSYLFTRFIRDELDKKLKAIEKYPKIEDIVEAYSLLDALADSKGFSKFRIDVMRRKNERDKGKIVKNTFNEDNQ